MQSSNTHSEGACRSIRNHVQPELSWIVCAPSELLGHLDVALAPQVKDWFILPDIRPAETSIMADENVDEMAEDIIWQMRWQMSEMADEKADELAGRHDTAACWPAQYSIWYVKSGNGLRALTGSSQNMPLQLAGMHQPRT